MTGDRSDTDSEEQPACWEVPVFGIDLLQPRAIVFSADTGRLVMCLGDRVIVPDDQVTTICTAARTALSVARRQRKGMR
jgi:hypothetical protein